METKSNWFGFAFILCLLTFFYFAGGGQAIWLFGIGLFLVLWFSTYLFPKSRKK